MSFSGSLDVIAAVDLVPSTNETRTRFAPSTTWSAVRMAPLRLTITPAPRSPASSFREGSSASIWTSDGRICWYTVAEVAGCACRSSIAFFTTPEAIVPTCARSSGDGDESRVAT